MVDWLIDSFLLGNDYMPIQQNIANIILDSEGKMLNETHFHLHRTYVLEVGNKITHK